MFKPKRGRYIGYQGITIDTISLQAFIDDILGGNGVFTNIEGEKELILVDGELKNDLWVRMYISLISIIF